MVLLDQQDLKVKVEQQEEQGGLDLKDRVVQLVALVGQVHKEELEVLVGQVHKVHKVLRVGLALRDSQVNLVPPEVLDGLVLKVELEEPELQV